MKTNYYYCFISGLLLPAVQCYEGTFRCNKAQRKSTSLWTSCHAQIAGWPALEVSNLQLGRQPMTYDKRHENDLAQQHFYTGQVLGGHLQGTAYLTYHQGSGELTGKLKLGPRAGPKDRLQISMTRSSEQGRKLAFEGTALKILTGSEKQEELVVHSEPHEPGDEGISYQANRAKNIEGHICSLHVDVDKSLYDGKHRNVERISRMLQELITELNEMFEDVRAPNGESIQFDFASMFIASEKVCTATDCDFLCKDDRRGNLNSRKFLKDYSKLDRSDFCASLLFTHHSFEDRVVGKANLRGICSPGLNTALIKVRSHDRTLHTLAHELGHLFGATHVDKPNRLMSKTQGSYFRADFLFTKKNLDDIKETLASKGHCLRETPASREGEALDNMCRTKRSLEYMAYSASAASSFQVPYSLIGLALSLPAAYQMMPVAVLGQTAAASACSLQCEQDMKLCTFNSSSISCIFTQMKLQSKPVYQGGDVELPDFYSGQASCHVGHKESQMEGRATITHNLPSNLFSGQIYLEEGISYEFDAQFEECEYSLIAEIEESTIVSYANDYIVGDELDEDWSDQDLDGLIWIAVVLLFGLVLECLVLLLILCCIFNMLRRAHVDETEAKLVH